MNEICLTFFFALQSAISTSQIKTNLDSLDIVKHMVTNNETILNVTVYSPENSETIIILHGGPGVPNEMKHIVKVLAEKFQVVYFEQRGTGRSRCSNCTYTMSDYISDIDSIALNLKIDRFHLFGHSWGGLYAQIYADKYPTKIQSLFLCSPSSGANKTWKKTEKEVMEFNKRMSTTGEWLKMGWNSLLGQFGSNKAYRRLFEQVYKNYHSEFEEINIQSEDLSGIFAEPINKTRKEIIKYKSLPIMNKPEFPICITYGLKDIYGESKNELIERYPTGELFEISECGHIPWVHNPVEFDNVMRRFYNL